MVVKVNCELLIACCAAAAIGFVAWHGNPAWLALLPVLVWIWRSCGSQAEAFAVLLCYYLAASRGLLQGANIYFGDPAGHPAIWVGAAVWVIPSLVLAGIWALFWGKNRLPLRFMLLLTTLVLPPVGIIGVANPITAAGALFPALGWTGMAMTIALLLLVAQAPRPILLFPVLAASIAAHATQTPTRLPNGWIGLNTQFGPGNDPANAYQRMIQLQAAAAEASHAAGPGGLILLPEMVAGNWALNGPWWNRLHSLAERRRQTILVGAYRPATDGPGYVNMLVSVGADPGRELVDRVPSPVSMWRPWNANSAQAFFFHPGVTRVGALRIAHLICYEQLLAWPVLISMLHRPDVIAAPSNEWWARENSIPKIQREAVTAWARLFNIPAVMASNQ